MRWTLARLCAAIAVFFICPDNSQAEDRLTLVETTSPYYPNLRHAKFTTPQWVDEDGVDAVIVLAIDDMRDPAKYEQYLRPIVQRLKQIDGRAPVSIMSNSVKPDDLQIRSWLDEGLSIECHTIDHPCPLLRETSPPPVRRMTAAST